MMIIHFILASRLLNQVRTRPNFTHGVSNPRVFAINSL